MTITPYLVRSQSLPSADNTDFYSGTEKDSTRASYDYLNRTPAAKQPPRYMLTPDNKNRWTKPPARAAPRLAGRQRAMQGDTQIGAPQAVILA